MTNHIELPSPMSNKVDEIKFLMELQIALDPSLYLSSLVTNELIHWFETMVNNDLAPDIMITLRCANEGRMGAVGDLVEQTEVSDTKVRAFEVTITQLQCAISESNADLKRITRQLDTAKQTIMEMQDDIEYLRAENNDYERTIVNLKAKMFDLQNPEE